MAILKAEKREGAGKYVAFNLRKAGRVPGVVYGKGMDNASISLSLKDLEAVLKTGAHLVDLDWDGQARKVVIKDVQRGTFDADVLHADFRAVSENETLDIDIPVELTGEAAGVVVGGMVEQGMYHVTVRCRPSALPDRIVVDIAGLGLGDVIYADSLPKLPGVQYVLHGNPPVASCHLPQRVEEAATPAEGVVAVAATPEVIGEKEREAKAKEKDAKK